MPPTSPFGDRCLPAAKLGLVLLVVLLLSPRAANAAGCHYFQVSESHSHELVLAENGGLVTRAAALRVYEGGRIFYRLGPLGPPCTGPHCDGSPSSNHMAAVPSHAPPRIVKYVPPVAKHLPADDRGELLVIATFCTVESYPQGLLRPPNFC